MPKGMSPQTSLNTNLDKGDLRGMTKDSLSGLS